MSPSALLPQQAFSRLRWRCRRGLLENELIIHRWLDDHVNNITVQQADALSLLLDLSDNDLLDLLLGRAQPQPSLAVPEVLTLLQEMRQPTQAAIRL